MSQMCPYICENIANMCLYVSLDQSLCVLICSGVAKHYVLRCPYLCPKCVLTCPYLCPYMCPYMQWRCETSPKSFRSKASYISFRAKASRSSSLVCMCVRVCVRVCVHACVNINTHSLSYVLKTPSLATLLAFPFLRKLLFT